MNRPLLHSVLPVLLLLVSSSAVAQHDDEGRRLNAFFAQEWERSLRESPEMASAEGDHRYDDRWTDYGPQAIAAREAADRAALQTLHGFDRSRLSPADQLNYDTYDWQLRHAAERQKFREYLQPIGHSGGPQSADNLAELLPFADERDYRN